MANLDPSCPHCKSSIQPPPSTLTTISPLLKALSAGSTTAGTTTVTPTDVTNAITHIFNNSLSPIQTTALLAALHYTRLDSDPQFIAAAAQGMRDAGVRIPGLDARFPPPPVVGEEGEGEEGGEGDDGRYRGGLVDIVGTGGDGHDTFNVSTTAAILATACGIQVCKHGNRASTSTSGSADILTALGADLANITPAKVLSLFPPGPQQQQQQPEAHSTGTGTFCFLFAPTYHPAMKHVAPIRRSLPYRTIFNFLGPLVNPVDYTLAQGLEARVIGVGHIGFGRIFADTLVHLGVTRAMVVCGAENLDEISPAGITHIWKLRKSPTPSSPVVIEEFKIHPTTTFGIKTHPLATVAGGRSPLANADILQDLLKGNIPPTGPAPETAILDFVLINTAALCVVAGVVPTAHRTGSRWIDDEMLDSDGVAVGEKWIEAVQLVRAGVNSGRAWTAWERFANVSREVQGVIRK